MNFSKLPVSTLSMRRHLFIIFMIALLPLRGWISDAMAMEMASPHAHQPAATKTVAAHAHESGVDVHVDSETALVQAAAAAVDCAGHAADAQPHAADSHCESCSACQACHTVALSPPAAPVAAVFDLGTPLRAAVARFASAEAALSQKPPIS